MGFGRRDYTGGSITEGGSVGRFSNNFNAYDNAVVPAGLPEYIYQYTVPDGYMLFLTGWNISAYNVILQGAALIKDTDVILSHSFILNLFINFGAMGAFVFEAGTTLKVRVFNYDELDVYFTVGLFGVLELID